MPIHPRYYFSKSEHSSTIFDEPEIVQLWILRALFKLNLVKGCIQDSHFEDNDFAYYFGLNHWVDVSKTNPYSEKEPQGELLFDPKQVLAELYDMYESAERDAECVRLPSTLSANINSLASVVGLSPVEQMILAFSALLHTHTEFRSWMDKLGSGGYRRAVNAISEVLDLKREQVSEALSSESALVGSGLLRFKSGCDADIGDRFDHLHSEFVDLLVSDLKRPIDLLKGLILESSSTSLSFSDYPHLRQNLDILLAYLQSAIGEGRRGVNILLYGPPGTGKTELASVISTHLKRRLYCISDEDTDGSALKDGNRFRAYMAGQAIFKRTESLFLFDEVEDVFSRGFFNDRDNKKSWINRLLENNELPTIWASNSIDCLDAAHARRFDMVLHVTAPPRAHRVELIRRSYGNLVGDEGAHRISEHQGITPALITRSARVVSMAKRQNDAIDSERAVETVLNGTLEAQSHSKIAKSRNIFAGDLYDLSATNADADLSGLVSGIMKHGSARLCLYGPPGTGKTAFGAWLAESLQKRHIVKRVSDLSSMWVGGTEKAIASAFAEAEQEGAVLQLDEVDSFLQDRRHARANWELTAVNEMLTQLESFNGVFIASTNLIDGLDQASIRRFDQKIYFGYLRPEQAQHLFAKYGAQMGLADTGLADFPDVKSLKNLTPGDFATVLRSSRFNRVESVEDFFLRLRAECSLKEDQPRQIGFIQ